MDLNKIKSIIEQHDSLYYLAVSKIEVMSSLNVKYWTHRGIENILFDNMVSVIYDEGCHSQNSFEFPLEWLTKTDEELSKIITEENEHEEKLKKESEQKDRHLNNMNKDNKSTEVNDTDKKSNISDVSSRAFRINKAREIYEDIFSLQSTEDYVGNDDLRNALTSITQYILKLNQC